MKGSTTTGTPQLPPPRTLDPDKSLTHPRQHMRQDAHPVSGLHQSTRRSILSSANRSSKNLAGARALLEKSLAHPGRQAVRVFDKNGTDVTPHPLYSAKVTAAEARHKFARFLDEISVGSTSEMSKDSVCSMPFSQSMTGSHMSTLVSPMADGHLPRQPVSIQGVGQKPEPVMEDVTEDMLKEEIYVCLTETDCITVLDIASTSVSVDSDDAPDVLERNRQYAEVCSSVSGTDKYVSELVQTLKGPVKNKHVQTDCVDLVDSAVEPYTALSTEQRESGGTVPPGWRNRQAAVDSSNATESLSTLRSVSTVSATSSRASGDEIGSSLTPELELRLIMSSENFQNCLQLMERVILANIFQPELASYRLLPNIKDQYLEMQKVEEMQPEEKENEEEEVVVEIEEVAEEEVVEKEEVVEEEVVEKEEVTEDWKAPQPPAQPPAVELLWVFNCVQLSRGRSVTTMAWNKKNPDVLAVGYGHFDFAHYNPGLVCCWSIKNSKWPNRVIHCEGAVTSLDFSFNNPSQLAVGMLDGTIVIYNIHDQDIKSCVCSTSESPSRHMGPVWQLKWCHQNLDFSPKKDCVDSLFSVAADGRACRWNQGSNGLDCVELMKLGRVLHTHKKAGGNTTEEKTEQDCLLTSLTPGLSFDFHSVDSNIYLIGTWDGLIHKCSCSNTQHFLETYKSHLCAVNAVTWSPFSPDVFLSCSSDCTIQLWKQNRPRPLVTFTCTHGAVQDIKWSPRQAAVFGVVSERQLEIWDLRLNMLEPVVVEPAAPTGNMKNLLFSTQTDCVLVGDSHGRVSVYQLKNLPGESSQVDILDDIINSVLSQ